MKSIISIPDIIFLNAGTNNPNTNDIVNNKQTKKLFETNFFGIIHCTEIFLPYLRKKNSQLVIMSSVAGYRGFLMLQRIVLLRLL